MTLKSQKRNSYFSELEQYRLDQRDPFTIPRSIEREMSRNARVLGRAIAQEFRSLRGPLAEAETARERGLIVERARRRFVRGFGFAALANRIVRTAEKLDERNNRDFELALDRASISATQKRRRLRRLGEVDSDRVIDSWRGQVMRRLRRRATREFDILRARVTSLRDDTPRFNLRNRIEDRIRQSQSNVILDTRGDITTLASRLTESRGDATGANEFIWRTQGDSKVRSSHRALNGKIFSYPDGAPGEGLPGEPPNCRCVAVPVFD